MRLVRGPIIDSPGFAGSVAWRPLREPDPGLAQVLSLPIALTVSTAVVVLWAVLTPFTDPKLDPQSLVATLVVLVPLHELTHAVAFPQSLRSARFTLALWPWRAHYDGEVSRIRYVTILGMPLVVISVVPALVSAMLGSVSHSVALISLLNALVSSGDVLAGILVLAQVPPEAVIRIRGSVIVWQPRPVKHAVTLAGGA
jgi:hypothetical protein